MNATPWQKGTQAGSRTTQVFRSVESLSNWIEESYLDSHLVRPNHTDHFNYRIDIARHKDVIFRHAQFTGLPTHVDTCVDGVYVTFIRRGSMGFGDREMASRGSSFIVNDRRRVLLRTPDEPFCSLSLFVNPVALESVVAEHCRYSGPTDDIFNHCVTPTSYELLASLRSASRYLSKSSGSLSSSDKLAMDQLEQLILIQMISAFPNRLQFNRTEIKLGARTEYRRAIEYLEDNYKNEITLDDIAEHAITSVSTLTRLFRIELGSTPIAHLSEIRLRRGQEALASPKLRDLSITQIASSVGFDDSGYFSRAFKKRFGITPNDFRKQKFKVVSQRRQH